ncbi:MAG: hypothetical protein II061_03000 [Bacteroidaceae bacterium]|nr:hypothetical protein [Bacteroidaceae bacterium]MBQ3628228.1 hypothetical protein [Bacteroidaceae bacterium]MBQ5461110.1 hypothetical protein [Bacteroidaceae bacterium]
MKKKQIFRVLYYILIVLWLMQIYFSGFNIYILIPTTCLIICYFLQKE